MNNLETIQKNDLPSGWRVVELGGVTKLTNVKFDLKDLVLNKYISTDNMLKNLGGIECAKKIPLTGKVKKFQEGDVLFSNIRTYFRKVWYATLDGGCSNDVLVFRSTKGIYSRYMYYLLADNTFIDYTDKTSKGTKMPRGDKDAILKYPAHIPPLSEQQAIAHILGKLDDKIALNRQINQTLETMAQTLFKSWFVNFDPVIDNALKAGNPIPDSLKTQATKRKTTKSTLPKTTQNLFPNRFVFNNKLKKWIPEGWEVENLDKIAHFQNGLALQKFRPKNEADDFLPVLKITHLKQGKTDGKEKSRVDIKKECIIDNGDIIFSWSASLFVDVWCGGNAALNQHLFKVTSKEYPKWFYYLWTKYHLKEFIRIASGKAVTMGHIKKEHLSEAKCVVMSNKLLGVISSYLEDNLNKQITNKLEMANLTKLRDTLLPKLISGKIQA
jgi:type I restriction enzyme S subunit